MFQVFLVQLLCLLIYTFIPWHFHSFYTFELFPDLLNFLNSGNAVFSNGVPLNDNSVTFPISENTS